MSPKGFKFYENFLEKQFPEYLRVSRLEVGLNGFFIFPEHIVSGSLFKDLKMYTMLQLKCKRIIFERLFKKFSITSKFSIKLEDPLSKIENRLLENGFITKFNFFEETALFKCLKIPEGKEEIFKEIIFDLIEMIENISLNIIPFFRGHFTWEYQGLKKLDISFSVFLKEGGFNLSVISDEEINEIDQTEILNKLKLLTITKTQNNMKSFFNEFFQFESINNFDWAIKAFENENSFLAVIFEYISANIENALKNESENYVVEVLKEDVLNNKFFKDYGKFSLNDILQISTYATSKLIDNDSRKFTEEAMATFSKCNNR